jgi:CRAL/TRIO domain
MLQMTPGVIKKLTNLWQEGSPLRQKGFHFINLPAVAPQSFFNLLTSFLSEKLRQRVHFHTNYTQTLFEHVPQHLLPAEYGGNSGKVDELMLKWKIKLQSYQKYFEDEANFGVDESKRLRDVSQELGTKGTFRQLEVD